MLGASNTNGYQKPIAVIYKFAAIYFLALLPFLATPELGGSSEAREAHVISVIAQTGEWVLPMRNGIIPSKPPLFHWIGAGLLKGFGTNSPYKDFLARLPSVFFGALTLLLGMLITKHIADNSLTLRKVALPAAMLAGGLLAFNYGFTSMALRSMVDMTFAFFVCAGLYVFIRRLTCSTDNLVTLQMRAVDYCLFYFMCGLAVLTKGPLGVVLPLVLAFVCICYYLGWRQALQQICRPRIGWIVFILVALPWYWLAIGQGGESFTNRQLLLENIERFTGAETAKPIWFYIPNFIKQAAPWSLFLLAYLFPQVRRFLHTAQVSQSNKNLTTLPLLMFLVGFAFFSISGGKRTSYLLPLYPFYSAWIALTFYSVADKLPKYIARIQPFLKPVALYYWLLSSLVFAFFIAFPNLNARFLEVLNELRPALIGYLILCALLFLINRFAAARISASLRNSWLPVGLLFVGLIAASQIGLAFKWSLKGYEKKAQEINQLVAASQPIVLLKSPRDEYFDSLLYYLERPVLLINSESQLGQVSSFLIVKQSWANQNKSELSQFKLVRRLARLRDKLQGEKDEAILLLQRNQV